MSTHHGYLGLLLNPMAVCFGKFHFNMGTPKAFFLLFMTFAAFVGSCTARTYGPSSDFVIVGAGTAGCALAARLCEGLPSATITLLERGGPRNDEDEFLVRAVRNSEIAWLTPSITESYETLPNPGLGGRRVGVFTGKTLGGTSAINPAQILRPPNGTVEEWGVEGLSGHVADALYEKVRETVGISVPPKNLQHKYIDDWFAAAEAVGLKVMPNGPVQGALEEGAAWPNELTATSEGMRRDSCTSYLTPVLNGVCAGRLKLLQGVTVSKIVVRKPWGKRRKPRAVGVRYIQTRGGRREEKFLRARREVISCAGPYESPKLLQLSGIGPAAELESQGVRVIRDLPVGKKVQDRALTGVISLYTGQPLPPEKNQSELQSPEAISKWSSGGGGPLGIGYLGITAQLGHSGYLFGTFALSPTDFPFSEPRVMVSGCIGNPTSFGTLLINGTDPLTPPAVFPNVFGNPSDLVGVKECMEKMGSLSASFSPTFEMNEVVPGNVTVDSEFLSSQAITSFHFVGGCRIGDVVDKQLRVKGVGNLRVVDASVVPRVPTSCGPMWSVYVLAEHTADMLIREYGYPY